MKTTTSKTTSNASSTVSKTLSTSISLTNKDQSVNKTQSAEKTSKIVAKKKALDLLFDVPLLPTGKNEIKKNSDQIKSALYEPMHINNPFSTNGKTIINVNITPNSRRRRSLGKRSSCLSTKYQFN